MGEVTRDQCGTREGVDLHASKGESMCRKCANYRSAELRRTPAARALRRAENRALSQLKSENYARYQALFSKHHAITVREEEERGA